MTQVTVTATYLAPDNVSPAAGRVVFTPYVAQSASTTTFYLGSVVAELNTVGHISASLLASDTVGLNPSGWTYTVREEIVGRGVREYAILVSVSDAGPGINLAEVAPATPGCNSYVLVPGPPGADGCGCQTYTVGTKPTVVYGQPPLVVGAWTQLWPDDDNRTFASVLGGTGVPGEIIYITANPLAAVTDPDVAQVHGDAGALYFETRGVNALYGRLAAGGPLVVRTSQSTSVARSPLPSGNIGVPDYRVLTDCGGGAVTYPIDGGDETSYAPVLAYDDLRLRASIFGDTNNILVVQAAEVPLNYIATGGNPHDASSGSFFPGFVNVEGVDDIRAVTNFDALPQGHVFWVRDLMEALP